MRCTFPWKIVAQFSLAVEQFRVSVGEWDDTDSPPEALIWQNKTKHRKPAKKKLNGSTKNAHLVPIRDVCRNEPYTHIRDISNTHILYVVYALRTHAREKVAVRMEI